jgi:assimilatory nitrate reductase catalytic subunit
MRQNCGRVLTKTMEESTTLTRSTCPYCGVGCGVIIESNGKRVIDVKGDPDHPANYGKLCSKGSTLHLSATPEITAQARALTPEFRKRRDLQRAPSDWETTLTYSAQRFADIIRQHGPDAVAFYISGQLLTEDYYVFNKLAKGLIGTNNVDTNSRLCMSSAVAGYKQTLGADAPPNCYEDIDHAQCFFIAGSNAAYAHPILFQRIEAARANQPNVKMIVVDPRLTDTAASADLHLAILPGTDVALFHGMLHIMLWEGWLDQSFIARHTNGFDALKALVKEATPGVTSRICGIPSDAVAQAARWFAQAGPTLSLYCQGLNQSSSGTNKNAALINLHLATGQIGKPGAGPFSLTGQPNAMGGREVGGMANLLSAHRDLSNADHRAEVAKLWGVPSVPSVPGKTAVELFNALADGSVKAVWIACTNPAQSMPALREVQEGLRKAEFVVVQEAFHTTATVPYADVLLPATTWAEKDGTVTNSERRISRVHAAIKAPGMARHDWQIVVDFAQRLERELGRTTKLFEYDSPESVWIEHRESTRGRDLDITGMSYAMLNAKPQQWPLPESVAEGRARLYEDGRFATPDGRARFATLAYQAPSQVQSPRFPFALTTGRLRDQWHGMSRTGNVAQLFSHAPEPTIDMALIDIQKRGLEKSRWVKVTSPYGEQIMRVRASSEVRAAQAFIAMHWGSEFLGGRNAFGVNGLTNPKCDPVSKQPELKHVPVRIEDHGLPHEILVMGWQNPRRVFQTRALLQREFSQHDVAQCTLFGRETSGLMFRAARLTPFSNADLQRIENAFGVGDAEFLRLDDSRKQTSRRLLLNSKQQLSYFMLLGDISPEYWLGEFLQTARSVEPIRKSLLAPFSQAPTDFKSRGTVVCNCFDVSETQIQHTLQELTGDVRHCLSELQEKLKCGTNCGSCLPQIKRIVNSTSERRPVDHV